MNKLIVIVLAIAALCTPAMGDIFDPPDWILPPVYNGITEIGGSTYPFGGTIKANIDPPYSYLTIALVTSPFGDGGFKYGGITGSVETYYEQASSDPLARGVTNCNGALFVQIKKGDYAFQAIGTPKFGMPVTASWEAISGYKVAPLFGMKQYTQTGDHTPIANGTSTFAKIGCCWIAMCAVAENLGANGGITPHIGAAMMDKAHGFTKDGYLIMPVACRILGMRYLGSRAFSNQTLAKCHSQGKGAIVKVHRPRRPKDKFHWVASTSGVVFDGSRVRSGLMNPCATDSGNYFDEAPFSQVECRIFTSNMNFTLTQDGWWRNLWLVKNMVSGGLPEGVSSAKTLGLSKAKTTAVMSSSALTVPSDSMLGMSEVNIVSSNTVRITRVERPGLSVLLTDIDSDGGSLIDTPDGLDDDEAEDLPAPPDLEPDPPLHSEYEQNLAPAGIYRLSLSGQPNAAYTLDVFKGDSFGGWKTTQIEGLLDAEGTVMVRIDHEPGNIVCSLAELKKMQIGNTVGLQNAPITFIDSAQHEFFCEDKNRVAGIRVTVTDGTTIPDAWSLALVVGKITSLSPELTVAADSVNYGGWIVPLVPLGMPNKWPEMANCLLAKNWGKVTSVDGSTAVIDNGSGSVTIRELDIPVVIGDQLSVNAVLRASHEVKAIAGTAKIEN